MILVFHPHFMKISVLMHCIEKLIIQQETDENKKNIEIHYLF